MFHWMSESSLVQQRLVYSGRLALFERKDEHLRASRDSNIHGTERAVMCTGQPQNSSKRHPRTPGATYVWLLSFHLRWQPERRTHWRQTRRATLSQLGGSCPKGRNGGEEKKKLREWRLIKGKPCFGRPELECLKSLIKIHTE